MVWMEFIKVQNASSQVVEMLKTFVSESAKLPGLLAAKVFVHSMIEDCSLCLLWQTSRIEPRGSSIGLYLAGTLKKFGLVDHSVWLEKNEREERKR